jgi:hypothetical protein
MRTLSIVGRGTHAGEQAAGYYNTGDRMKKQWGKTGAIWGGLWGRHITVETGAWINSRRVLISPISIVLRNWKWSRNETRKGV